VAIDRAGVLRNAEKFIRQGKVDQAIAEYVRLVEAQPDDWTSANALGDLYIRNAQSDKAVAQYARIADAFLARGFAPKAAALYKKILKIKADDEHALSQAAESAASQGLLVAARAHLNVLAAITRRRGDTAGSAAVALRLAALDPAEPGNRLSAARALVSRGDLTGAIDAFKSIAADLAEKGLFPRRLEVLEEVARLAAADVSLQRSLAEAYVAAGRIDGAAAVADALLALSPPEADGAVTVGMLLLPAAPETSHRIVLAAAAALAARQDPAAGIAACESWLRHRPGDAGMLSRVIELAVDAGLEDVLVVAQTRLVESHLAGGQAAQARVIAEDLVLRYPSDAAHRDRLREVLRAMGEPEPDEGSAATLTDGGQRTPIAPARHRSAGIEVDLSLVLDQMHKPIEPAEGPVDLDDVFARLRDQARRRSAADAAEKDFRRGVTLFQSGHIAESIPALEAAAKAPQCRFGAAAILGRIFLRRGVLSEAIEWLERAAEAPPRTPADGHAVLYDLAEALESTGDTTRAIAVYLQLHADAGPFRDVPERIARLSGLRTGR
jgi:tetratricopeptide (TPR) repeat protein